MMFSNEMLILYDITVKEYPILKYVNDGIGDVYGDIIRSGLLFKQSGNWERRFRCATPMDGSILCQWQCVHILNAMLNH